MVITSFDLGRCRDSWAHATRLLLSVGIPHEFVAALTCADIRRREPIDENAADAATVIATLVPSYRESS